MSAIEIDGLTKRYGSVNAVDGLDLTVERGEVFGFLGPNGAGKSTTINVLLDFVRPTDGRVSVLGYDPRTESRAVRDRIGILPEGYDLYGRLTARRNVAFAIELEDSDDECGDNCGGTTCSPAGNCWLSRRECSEDCRQNGSDHYCHDDCHCGC